MAPIELPKLRITIYLLIAMFSFVLCSLCAVRLHYTTSLHQGQPLHRGKTFYDPVVAGLFVTAVLTMAWCVFTIVCIHQRRETRWISTIRGELCCLGVLWSFWMILSSVITDYWRNLSWCTDRSKQCQILSALISFTWICSILVTIIFSLSAVFAFVFDSLTQPLHGYGRLGSSQTPHLIVNLPHLRRGFCAVRPGHRNLKNGHDRCVESGFSVSFEKEGEFAHLNDFRGARSKSI